MRAPTKKTAHQAMIDFLYVCRPERLAAVTVDQLQQRHGVTRKLAEYELTIARQKRAGGNG